MNAYELKLNDYKLGLAIHEKGTGNEELISLDYISDQGSDLEFKLFITEKGKNGSLFFWEETPGGSKTKGAYLLKPVPKEIEDLYGYGTMYRKSIKFDKSKMQKGHQSFKYMYISNDGIMVTGDIGITVRKGTPMFVVDKTKEGLLFMKKGQIYFGKYLEREYPQQCSDWRKFNIPTEKIPQYSEKQDIEEKIDFKSIPAWTVLVTRVSNIRNMAWGHINDGRFVAIYLNDETNYGVEKGEMYEYANIVPNDDIKSSVESTLTGVQPV